MIIWIDSNRKITAYNTVLTETQAQEYLSDNCVWLDTEMPSIGEIEENKHAEFYLNADNTISVTYVDNEIPEPTQADRIEENQLALMEAVASMYEENLENRLNDMEVQATIYETLLEMGGN